MNSHFLKFDQDCFCIVFPDQHRFEGGAYCRFYSSFELAEQPKPEQYMTAKTESYGNSLIPEVSHPLISNLDKLIKSPDPQSLITDGYKTAWFNSESYLNGDRSISLAVFPFADSMHFVVVDFSSNKEADELIREQIINGNVWSKPL